MFLVISCPVFGKIAITWSTFFSANSSQHDSNLYGSSSDVIILNSFLSSSSGALTSCLVSRIITHQWSIYRLFGGAIAGSFFSSILIRIIRSLHWLIRGFLYALFVEWSISATIKNSFKRSKLHFITLTLCSFLPYTTVFSSFICHYKT